MRRREFLRAGLPGLAGLTLPGLLALRARAGSTPRGERTALLVVWLQGGASHLETYDPKPDAPAEIRGPFGSIATKAEGVRVSELLPLPRRGGRQVRDPPLALAHGVLPPAGQSADVHGAPGAGAQAQARAPRPDVHRAPGAGRPEPRVPAYVGVNPIPYLGSAYLGPAYEPFAVHGDPNAPDFSGPRDRPADAGGGRPAGRPHGARGAASTGSAARSTTGRSRTTFDAFQRQAFTLLTGPEARRAFDLEPRRPAAPRPLRPQHLGPALPAGPAAGRGGRRPRHDEPRRPALRPGRQLGRPRRQPPRLRRHEGALPVLRPGRRRPDRGHPRARPRPPRARRGHRRVRPHAEDQLRQGLGLRRDAAGPRPLAPRRLAAVQRRAGSRAGRSSAPPTATGPT